MANTPPQPAAPEGFLLVDKPEGFTSHDVVAVLRRITGVRRIGHAGTLDPFATGLLVVGVGRGATKRLGEFLGMAKSYEAVAVLGATSDTQDKDGTVTPVPDAREVTAEEVAAVLPRFTGPQQQVPPMYSAKKIGGRKLYDLAREGKQVAREPNSIVVHELTAALHPHSSSLQLSVRCSSGTYVRTLAHDIGAALGTGAYLTALRRTAVGDISVDRAVPLRDITKENWPTLLQPLPPSH